MRSSDLVYVLLVICTCSFFRPVYCCSAAWLAYDTKCIKIDTDKRSSIQGNLVCGLQGAQLASVDSEDMTNFLAVHLRSYSHIPFWVAGPGEDDGSYFRSNYHCYAYEDGHVARTNCSRRLGVLCSHEKRMYNPTENCRQGLTQSASHQENIPYKSQDVTVCTWEVIDIKSCLIGDATSSFSLQVISRETTSYKSRQHSFIGAETGRCVFRTPDAMTERSAAHKCANDYGGTLLGLEEVLRDGLSAFNEHKVLMNDGFRYWTDVVIDTTIANTFQQLQSDTPSLRNLQIIVIPGPGECSKVSFKFLSVIILQLYQTECDDHAYALCGTPANGNSTRGFSSTPPAPLQQVGLSCPVGHNWKVYNGDCYWETSFETSRLSWDDARSYCKAFGGDLSSFHSLDEEKIGLSFQYGSLAHPYWIGLRLDPKTETFNWSDGSPLDYQNWAVGHPNHQDKRLQCVSFDAKSTNWKSSLCGVISWFICRAPKRPNPPTPVIPTPTPLARCDIDSSQFYFEDYCYSVVNTMFTWHRAKEYCENKGSSLVSIHSDEEIGFLLRLLYDDKNTRGNRIWIGLNTLRSGTLRWSDFSPVDFTYWNVNEPNNMRNVEKCCSMYIGNGLWNDEICNEQMGFVCKQLMNATVVHEIPTTPDPHIGNCNKGWYAHHDRCYLPVGYTDKERVNWTEASSICESKGGNLVSIRSSKEQAFLSYLMQGLQGDTWIGLHDTIHSGRYYWLDSSDIQYTNWAPGEPSFFGIQEDCVKMVYNDINSGVWRDDLCTRKLSFICYAEKDSTIPKPNYNRGLNCIFPEGWLKLGDMCFQMYAGNTATWESAENTCRMNGGHLISISGKSVQAVATYLGTEVNQTFWIGLKYRESSRRFEWLNGWPIFVTKWGKSEPSLSRAANLCYASTADGYWGKLPCNEEMPFICQITAGKTPARRQFTGNCPKTSENWIPTKGSYCHLYETARADWFGANIRCFRYGSYLISIHSLEDLEMIRKEMKSDIRSVFIGLMRNEREGFSWTDQSPVDFANWDEGQPENDREYCVEMMADTLKWRVAPCHAVKNFICSAHKDQLINEGPENSKFISGSSSGLSTTVLTGILVCSFFVLLVIIGVVFFCRPALGRSSFRNPFVQQSFSYENALYNADSASMEFQENGKEDSL